ncbi:MAG: hypothetical protein KDD55_08320, partial [Bdellovibrionales bacterium]|nr:hypothetical protein [Bdellovibrionales bacterium]
MQTTDQYRLIFEGPQDDSDETLRNLKGTFIAELEFSVEKAKEIFENTPYQILSATSEGELQSLYNLIQAAGGRVLIARPQTTDDHEEEFEFTFDMEEAEPQQQMKEKKDTPAPVYNLEFDPEDDPTEDEMVKELLAEGDAESKSAMEEKKAEDPLGLSGLSFDEPDHGPNNIIIPEEEPEPHAISLNFDTGETSTELLEEKKQAAPLSGIIEPTSSIDSLGLTFDEPDHEEEEKATSSIIDAEESALEEEESIVPLSESLLMDEGSEEKPEVFLEQDTELREEIELSPPVQELKEVPVSSSLTVESETEESISVESAESKPIPTPKKEVQENTPSAPQTTTTIEEHEHAKYQTKIEQPITNEFSESFDPKSERETRNKQAIIIGIVALLLVGNGYFIYSNFLAGDDL